MSLEDELTWLQRSAARTAAEFTRNPAWVYFGLPLFISVVHVGIGWFAWERVTVDPASAFRGAILATLGVSVGVSSLIDYPFVRALGLAYERVRALEQGGADARLPASRPSEPQPLPSAGVAAGPLRAACLAAFASGLLVCAVALWRFGGGEAAPAWMGIAMASAGGLGAGAALVASFLPRWMQRVAHLEAEARSGGGARGR